MNETQKRVLNKAIELFKNSSYEAVTINDICRESEISKHTFYYYFKSKEDLIRSSMMDFKDFESEVLSEVALLSNPLEKYFVSMNKRIGILENLGPELSKILLTKDMENSDNYSIDEDIRERVLNYRKMRVTFITEAQKQEIIRNQTEADKLVSYHGSLIHGIVHRWVFSGGKMNLSETIKDATQSLFNYK